MINKSPTRNTFQQEGYIKRCEEQGKVPNPAYIRMFKTWQQQKLELEETDEWKVDNMEYDLRSTQWIIDKVKGDDVYAQHLYAAMCNNEFTKNEVWPILTEKRWGCSWRSAGGIIADMKEKGDYIDWYCSGIRDATELDDDQFRALTKEQQEYYIQGKAFVPESVVTDEIREDLLKLGWIVIDESNDNC
jgi:hypothetical protein